MQKVSSVIVAAAFLVLATCIPPEIIEVDSINIDPPGGYAVEKLTAEIHAQATGSHNVKVEWKWRGEGSSDEDVVKTEYITMDHDGNYYSTYRASSGYVLLNYFWIEVYDEEETLLKKSSEVYCFYD